VSETPLSSTKIHIDKTRREQTMKWMSMLGAGATVVACALSYAASAETPKQGGSMVVSYKEDITTLDPAIGYDWQNPSMMQALFDGLMDYEPGTTTLTPDLAESYNVSPDGLSYTFNLRKGVTFHNGRELTSADVKYTLERLANPSTQSPGQSYFSQIVGFDDFVAGNSTELTGVKTPDPYTVVVEMSHPTAYFLNVLAMHFGSIVPKEEVEKWGEDFGHHPVGTGAFKLTEWTLGQRIVFERNAEYFKPGVPYLDKIVFEIGQEPNIALLRLLNGEIDIAGDGIAPAQYVEVTTGAETKDLVVISDQLQTGYLTLNVTEPPFDNLLVRQAVNMAINKDRIVQIVNNRPTPANQPLPPLMPGYDSGYQGYAFDPEKAKALLVEAGYPDGFKTELYAMNVDPNPRIAQAIQQDLAVIGIEAELQSLSQGVVIETGGQGEAPMLWSGGMAWIADFPDPSGFYWPILSCGATAPGGWNWAKYCNEALDARGVEADAMVDPAQAAERVEKWRGIYLDVMNELPWVPIFNDKGVLIHSDRIGGDDVFFVSPVHIPIWYDYLYAKDAQ
jgi:ABC-type transport system substrate-binding protein